MEENGLKKEYSHLYMTSTTVADAAERLAEIMSVLRKECPWDKVQTHKTMRKCLLEESYEACDAIDRDDMANLREELGDVSMVVFLNAEIAKENGDFDIIDVINDECEKMIRRHPHIFSDSEAKTIDKVLEKWENVKSKEHGNITHTQRLTDVPIALPALTRCNKVKKRAADAGFEYGSITEALDKVYEELEELREAIDGAKVTEMQEELGDLLFSVVNVSRFAGLDPEESLNIATGKFIDRFEKLEKRAVAEGRDIEKMSAEELSSLWSEIKK